MDAKLMFVHALSPLHAGTGQGVGVIDLPIAREKATDIPFLPGSTLKGVFRDACGDDEKCIRVFGPKTTNADDHAGAVVFTDARLLLLPVRSLKGVFAWVTSPLMLRRLARDAENVQGLPLLPEQNLSVGENACLVSDEGCALKMTLDGAEKAILEDLPLAVDGSAEVKAWAVWLGKMLFPNDEAEDDKAWRAALNARLCIVPDDTLSFLLETATEITARIRIEDDKKTVAQGALWYEEALPAETILAGLVLAATVKASPQEVFDTVRSLSEGKTFQFGGNATVGRGLCKATMIG